MGVVVNAAYIFLQYTVLTIWIWLIIIPLIIAKYWLDGRRKSLTTTGRLDGKTYIVTGCNKGIGYQTALELSKRGARVLMACRNLGSGHLAKKVIAHESGNDDIDVYRLDLSSFWSIRQFVKDILDNEGRIDGIIFNAGVGLIKNKMTKDDLPLVWQINYYSSFMIIQLLYGILKKTGSAQIIFLSSSFHHLQRFDIEDIMCVKKTCPWTIYCNTKFATVLMSNYLADKLKGTGITVNCVNPGWVRTPILRRVRNYYVQSLLGLILNLYGKSEKDGAATTLNLALNPILKWTTGKYFSNCQETWCVSSKTKNMTLAAELWEKSKILTRLNADEISL